MTDQQRAFIREYLVDLNGAQAAIRAGYSTERARKTAYELLRHPAIREEVQKAMDERAEEVGITAERVLREVASIAFDDIGNYLEFRTNEESGIVELAIKDSETIDTKNISEISLSKEGTFKFKLYCKDRALELLGKHLKLFSDRVEHDVSDALATRLAEARKRLDG